MQREDFKSAVLIVLCVVSIGFVLTVLSIVSMRMAYHRAYTEIASSCDRISLLTVDDTKYFCAPVARIEGAPVEPTGTTVRL